MTLEQIMDAHNMVRLPLVGAMILCALGISDARASGNELLSIEGVSLTEKQYVAGFDIKTWGVTVVAVCHFPPAWSLVAVNSADPQGRLAGSASHGVAALNKQRLNQLQSLFLVRVDDYHEEEQPIPHGTIPATFVGSLSIGTYGTDDFPGRDVPISPSNLVRRPATRCPDPD